MPVLITDAGRPLARRLALRLLAEGGEVRAYGEGDLVPLRAAGVFVATGAPDDEGRLDAAMTDVHTVVHVGAGLLTSDLDASLAAARATLGAAASAGVARVLLLSLPGAGLDAADPVRRTKGAVEAGAVDADVPTVVLRVGLVDTPALRDALATARLPEPVRQVEIAPVRDTDLLELVVAFDGLRSTARSGHATFLASGPRRMTVAAYLQRVGVAGPGAGGMVGRRLASEVELARLAQVLAGPWDEQGEDAWAFAGLQPAAPGPKG